MKRNSGRPYKDHPFGPELFTIENVRQRKFEENMEHLGLLVNDVGCFMFNTEINEIKSEKQMKAALFPEYFFIRRG